MNIHLKKYLDIYQKFPIENYLTKEERKKRHSMLVEWENTKISSLPTLNEFINFLKENKNVIHITPQFFNQFRAVWQEDLENSYQFAECLLEINLNEWIIHRLDIEILNLAEQVLKHNSNHIKALILKLKNLTRYHNFCLHELPWGVLVEESLEDELQSVKEMEKIAEKLNYKNKDFELLISYCKTYYPLWFEYLSLKEKDGFKNFLEEKEIDTQRISVPYIAFNETL